MTDDDNEREEPAQRDARQAEPCPVAGIGASAGGIEALQALMDAAPADGGVAWVVVIHLLANSQSRLADVLATHTDMPVETVNGATPVQPDHVYVIAPGTVLEYGDGILRPKPRDGENGNGGNGGNGRRTPVDHFFLTLAEGLGARTACAVLSGTGSDGSLGLRAVKEQGGLCLAQDPDSATHRGMPASAIETGIIDLVLAPSEIPGAVTRFFARQREDLRKAGPDGTRPDVVEQLPAITRILHERTGEDFSSYKPSTLARRVQRRMQALQVGEVESYEKRLRTDEDEARLLLGDLLIGVTHFFRDPDSFEALRERAVPTLFEDREQKDTIRAWAVGCSTGEEAYSIAMLLLEQARAADDPPSITVFASDVDRRAIERARRGRYPASAVEHVPEDLLERYFHRDGDFYTVCNVLRESVLFSQHNVLRDPPFSRIDLITCRNLLIYLESGIQGRVLQIFYHVLRERGWLMLGAAETVGRESVRFEPASDRGTRLYRARVGAKDAVPDLPLMSRARGQQGQYMRATPVEGGMMSRVERMVIDRFAPAWAVVDREMTARRFSGRTGKFLQAPSGPPSADIVAMARPELRAPLRSALSKAFRTGERVATWGLSVEIESGTQDFDLVVEPVSGGSGDEEKLCLVVFSESRPMEASGQPSPRRFEAEEQQRQHADTLQERDVDEEIHRLRERLSTTTEELQTSNEELKASNEELASMNEELQSANEELETSKEELQSSNEELQTVNAELQGRVEDLARANNDLRNLFQNTAVATLFVDNELCIRSYTPMLGAIFHVVEHDKGRPLTHIAHRLDDDRIFDDIRRVLADLQRIEREVEAKDGTFYILRIQPYYTLDSRIDGAVVTFVDVSRLKASERRLERSRRHERLLQRELQHRVKNILANVRALSSHTYNESSDLDAFHESFEGRIAALARTQNLISATFAQYVNLEDAVREELLAHAVDTEDKVSIRGPELLFEPRSAQTMALAIHELATNAVKYGALADDKGRIDVSWRVEERHGAPHMVLQWCESGLELKENTHRPTGFGRRLIEELTPYELDGTSQLSFPRDGCQCIIDIPFEKNIRPFDKSIQPEDHSAGHAGEGGKK